MSHIKPFAQCQSERKTLPGTFVHDLLRELNPKLLGFFFCRICSPSDLEKRFEKRDAAEEGFDIVIDCTGVPAAIAQAFNFMRRGGKGIVTVIAFMFDYDSIEFSHCRLSLDVLRR